MAPRRTLSPLDSTSYLLHCCAILQYVSVQSIIIQQLYSSQHVAQHCRTMYWHNIMCCMYDMRRLWQHKSMIRKVWNINFHFDRESLCTRFRVFRQGYAHVEWESSMFRWRSNSSIQRYQLELLTTSGDGEIHENVCMEKPTLTLFLIWCYS